VCTSCARTHRGPDRARGATFPDTAMPEIRCRSRSQDENTGDLRIRRPRVGFGTPLDVERTQETSSGRAEPINRWRQQCRASCGTTAASRAQPGPPPFREGGRPHRLQAGPTMPWSIRSVKRSTCSSMG
jgi:hypothetical protein